MDDLLLRARKGDGEAFAEILRTYERSMYRAAYAYLKNEADALDAVQEASYRAFLNLKRLKEPGYVGTWLVRIAINCAVDIIRKRRRTDELDALPGNAAQLAYSDDALGRIEVQELLGMLDEDEKRLIGLRYFDGYTFSEMSELERRPLGSVKSALYRALEKLRRNAKEEKHE